MVYAVTLKDIWANIRRRCGESDENQDSYLGGWGEVDGRQRFRFCTPKPLVASNGSQVSASHHRLWQTLTSKRLFRPLWALQCARRQRHIRVEFSLGKSSFEVVCGSTYVVNGVYVSAGMCVARTQGQANSLMVWLPDGGISRAGIPSTNQTASQAHISATSYSQPHHILNYIIYIQLSGGQ